MNRANSVNTAAGPETRYRNMESTWTPSLAIFFLTYYYARREHDPFASGFTTAADHEGTSFECSGS